MKTEWKDVAHLYFGCEGIAITEPRGIEKMIGVNETTLITNVDEIMKDDFKPILRKLSDMTEAEAKELDLADVQIGLLKFSDRFRMFMTADQLNAMLKMGFDLFSLIPNGYAFNRTTLPSLTNQ